jgi:hypothetical protein
MQTKNPVVTDQMDVANGLRCDIKRGPNWLFVRLHPSDALASSMAEAQQWGDELWGICQRHFTYRLVMELDEVADLSEEMSDELAHLELRLAERGGALRLCGMSAECEQRLDPAHSTLMNHSSRRDAVLSTDSHSSVIKPH